MSAGETPNLFGDMEPSYVAESASAEEPQAGMPLAARMRPRTLEEFAGQQAIVGPGSQLRRAIEQDRLTSALFWGPPGCGKSTLASVIARATNAAFENYSAVTSGVAEVRLVIQRARERRTRLRRRTILFVDEIHRWNKSQQDALLPHVEDGTVVLIGATTENPSFSVNTPLLSRTRVYRFAPLEPEAVRRLIERALSDCERGLGGLRVGLEPAALDFLVQYSGGDARRALNGLEAAALERAGDMDAAVSVRDVEQAVQRRQIAYDRDGDEHYDTISAFIKSVRGSDADAAVYWMTKMLLAGEDPVFIARRMVILASEDVGNADPRALPLAVSAAQAVQMIGMPEGRLILAQTATYLATAPKSNAAYVALGRASADIERDGPAPVPVHLRSTGYAGAKALGHGEGYLYPHDFAGGETVQEYLALGVQSERYYAPPAFAWSLRPVGKVSRVRAVVDGAVIDLPICGEISRFEIVVEMLDERPEG